jgi:hypothetical protein
VMVSVVMVVWGRWWWCVSVMGKNRLPNMPR